MTKKERYCGDCEQMDIHSKQGALVLKSSEIWSPINVCVC